MSFKQRCRTVLDVFLNKKYFEQTYILNFVVVHIDVIQLHILG